VKITARLAAAALAVAAVATLAGCAPTAAPLDADAGYVAAVQTAAPSLADTEATTLIDSGRGVCSSLDNGMTHDRLITRAVSAGLLIEEGSAIVDNAISFYCPQHVVLIAA
jgi:hypothetical protein